MAYNESVPHIEKLGRIINSECARLLPDDIELIAEPGRFMVANAATLVTEIIGRARRDGKLFYHVNDGVYHTFSGVVYEHWIPNFHALRRGSPEVCAVVGPTCDSFDKISVSEELPGNLKLGDYLYTENIGAYSMRLDDNIQRVRRGKNTSSEQTIICGSFAARHNSPWIIPNLLLGGK